MLKKITILTVSQSKKLLLSLLFTGAAAISFAGIGDGGKSKVTSLFTPVKITNGFTLKAGHNYRSTIFTEERKQPNYLQLNSMVTYQKGNVTYILPHNQKISVSAGKSNLQAINLRVNIRH